MNDRKHTEWRMGFGADAGARAHRLSAHGAAYSVFVRGARYVLPALALVIAGLVIARLAHNPLQEQLSQLPADERTLPGQSALEGARYEGADMQGRPFVLEADRALRVLPDNAPAAGLSPLDGETVDLIRPSATMTMGEDATMTLRASEGRFEQDSSSLDLGGGVTLTDDKGNALWLDNVNVDLKDNALVGDTPVRGRGPDGTIDAQGLRLENGGEKVIFMGTTTLTLPAAKKPEAKKDSAP